MDRRRAERGNREKDQGRQAAGPGTGTTGRQDSFDTETFYIHQYDHELNEGKSK